MLSARSLLSPRNWGRLLAQLTLVSVIFMGVSCTTIPETGRSAIRFVPDSLLTPMAVSQFAQMKQEVPLSQDPVVNARIQKIGERVSAVVADKMPNADWEFVVFDQPVVNAFAMPGGKVGFYTGLIDLAENDAEIAAVMGHEVAHVTLKHGNERMSQALVQQGLLLGIEYYMRERPEQVKQTVRQVYGLGSQLAVMLPYSRTHEREADRVGLLYAAKAGYDPRAAVTFWQKMQAQGGEQPPQMFSTHPSHEDRIERLEALMPEALAIYEQSRKM